jgi:hypothetical protein
MKKTLLCVLGVIALTIFASIVTGCYRNDPIAYAQPAVVAAPGLAVAPAPVTVVQAAPSHDGLLTGLLMGHMMSGGGGYHAPVQHTTVVNQSVTRNVTVNKAVIAAPRANAYVYRAPSRPANFGSFKRR